MHALADPAQGAPRWSDLGRRAVSAALLAPLALACIWLGGAAWAALMTLAAAGLSLEWLGLCGVRPERLPGVAVPATVLLATIAAAMGQPQLGLVVGMAGFFALWLWSGRLWLAAGIPYLGVAAVALVWLREGGAPGRANVLFLVLVVWASDIGAYAAGRLLGGPKLAPALSPGKTWTGAAGGLLAAVVTGVVVAALLQPESGLRAGLLAAGLGVASQAGDLLESGIKRHFGVKDTGRLIPGHGGLLDRLDGLLAAAPAAAALAVMMGRGGVIWQ